MDERLFEAAIRGDVIKLLHLLNEDILMQAEETFLDRVIRDCIGKDNPLHLGALFGHVEFVSVMSSRKPEFARQLNSKGQSPLHLAAERGHLQVVKVLLETDADVCFVRDQDGRIPLHLAVIKGRVKVVEELVNAWKITAWFLTNEKEPILHLCSNHDQFDVLKELVSLVNDDDTFVRLKDSNDNTILHLLSANVQPEMAKFLLDNTNIELEINALNVENFTALDELYRAQLDLGYFRLRIMLRGKGAKPALALRIGQPIPYQRKRTSPYRKQLQRMEAPFLVFAILIATVTYQAAFNPPGGLWKDDYPPPSPDKGKNDTRQHHKAGEPILLYEKPVSYHLFNFFNNLGFYASSATIATIVIGHRLSIGFVRISVMVVLLAWMEAYVFGVYSVSPVSIYYTIFMFIFFPVWPLLAR